jgi:hypothetical protein
MASPPLRYGHDYVDIGEQAYELQFRARRFEATEELFGYGDTSEGKDPAAAKIVDRPGLNQAGV